MQSSPSDSHQSIDINFCLSEVWEEVQRWAGQRTRFQRNHVWIRLVFDQKQVHKRHCKRHSTVRRSVLQHVFLVFAQLQPSWAPAVIFLTYSWFKIVKVIVFFSQNWFIKAKKMIREISSSTLLLQTTDLRWIYIFLILICDDFVTANNPSLFHEAICGI